MVYNIQVSNNCQLIKNSYKSLEGKIWLNNCKSYSFYPETYEYEQGKIYSFNTPIIWNINYFTFSCKIIVLNQILNVFLLHFQ